MFDKTSIKQAVLDGLKRGFDFVSAKKEQHDRDMSLSFNAASGVLEGLTVLSRLPGSKFEFTAYQNSGNGDYNMRTNIPVYGRLLNKMLVYAVPSGEIKVLGDKLGFADENLSVRSGDPGASEKIVSYVAERAVKAGLIPQKAL